MTAPRYRESRSITEKQKTLDVMLLAQSRMVDDDGIVKPYFRVDYMQIREKINKIKTDLRNMRG